MWRVFVSLFLLFVSFSSRADIRVLTYQGVLTNSMDEPYTSTQTVTFDILSPAPGSCLLYQEKQSITPDSAGRFSAQIGTGTRTDNLTHPFKQVFVNGGTLSGLTCATASVTAYTAGATEERVLQVSVNGVALSPTVSIKAVPYAMQALEIQGWGLDNLVKVSSVGSPTTFTNTEMAHAKAITGLTCASGEIIKWNGSAWACGADSTSGVLAIGNGGTGQTTKIAGFDALSPLTTKGDLITRDAANNIRVSVGTDGQVLTADSTQSGGFKWATPITGSVTSVTASAPLASGGGATPNITITRSSAIADGYLSSTDWNTFNSKLGTSSTFAGDVSGTSSTTSVDKIKGTALSIGPLAIGNVLKYDGTNWINTMLAAADIPGLDAAQIMTGTLPVARGGTAATSFTANKIVATNGTGSGLTDFTCTIGQVIKFDASGYATCGSDKGPSGSEFVNGGNSFAATAVLGTNDANSLAFETNGITKMTIDANGGVGVGLPAPRETLDIAGNIRFGKSPADLTSVSMNMSTGTEPVYVSNNSHSGYPASGTLLIDDEIMTYTNKGIDRFDGITRGVFNTTPAIHNAGTSPARIGHYLAIIPADFTSTPAMVINHSVYDPATVGADGFKVGIGTARPENILDVARIGPYAYFSITNYTSIADRSPKIILRKSHTESEAKVATVLNDSLGKIEFQGVAGSAPAWTPSAFIQAVQTANSSTSTTIAPQTKLVFHTADGATGLQERLTIYGDGNVFVGDSTLGSPASVTMTVKGRIKLAKHNAAPICDLSHDGEIALTSKYTTCVCNGNTPAWVSTQDGATPCNW